MLVVLATACLANAWTLTGSPISSNSVKTGRMYFSVVDNYGNPVVGVSAPSGSTSAAIRGVPTGTYTVNAYIDSLGTGFQHASDPVYTSGQISVSGDSTNPVVFNDPVAVAPVAPKKPNVVPLDGAAFVQFDPPKQNNISIADSYNIYWSSTPTPGPANIVGGGQILNITTKQPKIVVPNLSNGTTLYFAVTAVSGASSATSAVSGPVTINPPAVVTGTSSVSVTVDSTGIQKNNPYTPLLVALSDDNDRLFVNYAKAPGNLQTVTVPGVSAGTYKIYAILNLAGDGNLDTLSNVSNMSEADRNQRAVPIMVDGVSPAVVGPTLKLTQNSAGVNVSTSHQRQNGTDNFQLNFRVQGTSRQLVNVSLDSGPQVSGPIDLSIDPNNGGSTGVYQFSQQVNYRPAVGDSYGFTLSYADGTEQRSASVTRVLDSFPGVSFPIGSIGPGGVAPTFSWNTNANWPGFMSANINLNNFNMGLLPLSQFSVPYQGAPLSLGQPYYWNWSLQDFDGNQVQMNLNFTPSSSGPTITDFNPKSGAAGTSIVITGSGFDTTPANNSVTIGGSVASVTQATSGSLTVSAPASSGVVVVTTGGVSAGSSVPFAGTINMTVTLTEGIDGISAISGATMSLVENPAVATTSNSSGVGVLAVPARPAFSLLFTPTDPAIHLPTASSLMNQTSDNSSGWSLFRIDDLTTRGVMPTTGKGLIYSRVQDNSAGGSTLPNVAGAVVTATSLLHPATPYVVKYTNGTTTAQDPAVFTQTASDGRYYVLNVDEGDYVTVTASKSGMGFQNRVFNTHAGTVFQGSIRGATASAVTANPPGGVYSGPQLVTLTATANDTIYYTTNGSDPTFFGTKYTAPVTVQLGTKLQFVAINKNQNQAVGGVGTAYYSTGSQAGTADGTYSLVQSYNLNLTGASAGSVSGLQITIPLPSGVTVPAAADGTVSSGALTSTLGGVLIASVKPDPVSGQNLLTIAYVGSSASLTDGMLLATINCSVVVPGTVLTPSSVSAVNGSGVAVPGIGVNLSAGSLGNTVSMNWLDANFCSNKGPSLGPNVKTITSLTATSMTWAGGNGDTPLTWSRASGTPGSLLGSWSTTQSTGDSFQATFFSNGTVAVSGTIFDCGSGGDNQAPSVPTGLNAAPASPTSVALSWNPSSDNVGVTNYQVFRNGTMVGQPSGQTNTSWTDSNVALNGSYSYSVSACDGAGNCSAQSAPAVQVTVAGVPGTASGIYNYATGNQLLTLGWQASNFACNGPGIKTETKTATFPTANTMNWQDTSNTANSMSWTRVSGTTGILGTWSATDPSSGSSFSLTFTADGTLSATGSVFCGGSGSAVPGTPVPDVLAFLATSGSYDFWHNNGLYSYDKSSYNSVNKKIANSSYQYNSVSNAWVLQVPQAGASQTKYYLGATGWTLLPSTAAMTVASNTDGSAGVSNGYGMNFSVQVYWQDLTGTSISSNMASRFDNSSVFGAATFPAGSKGVQGVYTAAFNYYELYAGFTVASAATAAGLPASYPTGGSAYLPAGTSDFALQFNTDGTAEVFSSVGLFNANGQVILQNPTHFGSTSWSVVTDPASSAQIMVVDMTNMDDWSAVYAVLPSDGKLHGGVGYLTSYPWHDSSSSVNLTAFNGALAALNLPQLPVPAPVVSGFTPASGLVGSEVTITGSNLLGATVTINGVGALPTGSSNSDTSLTVAVLTGTTSGKIAVTTANGSASSSANFTVLSSATGSAGGTWGYDATSGLLSLFWTTATFTCDGPSLGVEIQTVQTLTATTMTWGKSNGTPMTWTRVGTGSTIVGNWSYTDSSTGNSYTASFNADGTLSVTGNTIACGGPTDNQAPTVPTGLGAGGVSTSQVKLSWHPATDNVGVSYYQLFRNGSLVAQPSGTTWYDSSLSAATSYSYQVAACDAANNCSAQSTPPVQATTAATTFVTLSWGAVYPDLASDGIQYDVLDVGVNSFASTLAGAGVASITVTGPNGFSASFSDADLDPDPSGQLAFSRSTPTSGPGAQAKLVSGVYTITLTDSNGHQSHRMANYVAPVATLPRVDSSTVQLQRKSDGSYRFSWAPVNDTKTYYYRVKISTAANAAVYYSDRAMTSYADVPAGIMTDGSGYQVRVDVFNAPSFDLFTNRSDSVNLPFTPQAADFTPQQVLVNLVSAVNLATSSSTTVTQVYLSVDNPAAVTLLELLNPNGTLNYTFNTATDIVKRTGNLAGGSVSTDFIHSFGAALPPGTYKLHIVTAAGDQYAYATLTTPVIYPAVNVATRQAEDLGNGNIRFSWANVNVTGALEYRVVIQDTVTNVNYFSARSNQAFVDVPKSVLGSNPLKWDVEVHDSTTINTLRNRTNTNFISLSPVAYDPTRPTINAFRVRNMTRVGANFTHLGVAAVAPQSTLTSIVITGPGSYSRDLLAQGRFSTDFNSYFLEEAGSPASGLYTITVTASSGKTATRYIYQPAVHQVPTVDYHTLHVDPEANGDVRVSWAPVASDVPLWFQVAVYAQTDQNSDGLIDRSYTPYVMQDINGDGVLEKVNMLQQASLVIPAADLTTLVDPSMSQIRTFDGSDTSVINNYSQSVMVPTGSALVGFDYSTLTDNDNNGYADNLDPTVAPLLAGNSALQPVLSSATPAAGALNVSTGTTVSAVFNKVIDQRTLAANFSISGGVAGALTYNPATRTLYFIPSAPLALATSYNVTIGTGVQDEAGNHLSAPVTWSFSTGSVGNLLNQTISPFAFPGGSFNVGGTVSVSASASSGLSVTFSSLTPSVCSVSGSAVTALTTGPCTVAANQAGNGSYSSAPQVTASVTVLPPVSTTTSTPSASPVKPGASVVYTVSYMNADSITLSAGNITVNKTGTANGFVTAISGTTNTTRNVTISNITGEGTLGITVAAGTASGSAGTASATGSLPSATCTVDATAPLLSVTALPNGTTTSNNTLNVSGTASDSNGIAGFTVNGTPVTLIDGAFNTAVTLTTGPNQVTVVATDQAGNQATDTRTIILDNTAPAVTFLSPTPADGSFTNQQGATLAGTVSKAGNVSVTVNGGTPSVVATSGATNSFSIPITLAAGANTISILASDLDTPPNSSTVSRSVTFDATAPVLAITDPAQDITTSLSSYLVKGTVTDNFTGSTVSVAVNGVTLVPSLAVAGDGTFQQSVTFSTAKTYSVAVTATDKAGNTSATVQRNIVYNPPVTSGATIDLGSAGGVRGKTVVIPITLTNAVGVQIATASVDISYDPTLLLNPTAVLGAAGTAAGKLILTSNPSVGVFRVAVYDTGNAVLGNGVLANVSFGIPLTAVVGSSVPLGNLPTASDPIGTDLVITGSNGTATVVPLSGDCNGDNSVTPGEFTSAINRFMGRAAGGTACTTFYTSVNVTPGYFTKVINAFMGR